MNCCSNKNKVRNIEEKKAYNSRINKIIGQLNGIKKMIDEDKYCNDILIQLLATEKAMRSLSNLLLDNHFHTCLVNDIKNGNEEVVDEALDLLRRFQK